MTLELVEVIVFSGPPDSLVVLVIVIPVGIVFIFLLNYFRDSVRELQRIESICRSPIFQHFSESLTGLSTIRAYKQEEGTIC